MQIGEIVLVKLDDHIRRPLLVSATEVLRDRGQTFRVSGTIFAEPEDHTTPAFRGKAEKTGDPARITGRPDRNFPLGYGTSLAEGSEIGQWIPRPSYLPARS